MGRGRRGVRDVGACLADQVAAHGLDLILIARNGPLLNDVAAGIRERHGVEVRSLPLDLTEPQVGAEVAVATEGLEVGLIIYNAGGANRTRPLLRAAPGGEIGRSGTRRTSPGHPGCAKSVPATPGGRRL